MQVSVSSIDLNLQEAAKDKREKERYTIDDDKRTQAGAFLIRYDMIKIYSP